MRKATATYNAPEGDNKVVEMGGLTFFDGQAVELNSADHGHLINKLPGNQHFDMELGEEEPDEKPAKRGRPTNAERAAKFDSESQRAAQPSGNVGQSGLNQNAQNALNNSTF